MDIPPFICSSVGRHLGCFCFLTITTIAAVNICIRVCLDIRFHFSLVFVPRSEPAGSCGSSVV